MDRATCEAYYKNPDLGLGLLFVRYFIAMCMEDTTGFGGLGSSEGINKFVSTIANEYFADSMQVSSLKAV